MVTVSVIGMGFVGLTLSAFMASKGIRTIGVDANREIISRLQKGEPHFYEKGLANMVGKSLKKRTLTFATNFTDVQKSEIVFICVGTPSSYDGAIDLSSVRSVCEELGKIISLDQKYRLIVVKSTVTPGTTAGLVMTQLEKSSSKKCGIHFGLVMNPEFLREGSAVDDTARPHLIVIGGQHKRDMKILGSLYARLHGKLLPDIIETTQSTAELIKYANNAFLATKISFINSIANVCQNIPGADVEIVARAIGQDPRIGPLFLRAGPGYGGSCLPKDVSALISFCKNNLKIEPILISAANELNSNQPYEALKIVERRLQSLSGKTISVLGLAFKKDTDDVREAVSLKIISHLIKSGASVRVHDPMAMEKVKAIFGDKVNYFESAADCLKDSECCLILTEWDEYAKLKPSTFMKNMKTPIVVDARRVLNPSLFRNKAGLAYLAVGLSNES